jgi:hypothetical protein
MSLKLCGKYSYILQPFRKGINLPHPFLKDVVA